MAQNYDLQLLTPDANGKTVAMVGVWVQLVNNDTGTSYVSTAITTGTGKATFAPKPPGDTYVINTSAVSNSGPWTAFGISNHAVPVVDGDSPSFQGVTTQVIGPYGAFLPGAPSIPTPAGIITGRVWEWGDGVYHLKAANAKFDGVTNDTAAWNAGLTAVQGFAADGATAGGQIQVPFGVSIHTTKLSSTTSNVRLTGLGKTASVLKRGNAMNDYQIQMTGCKNWTWEYMGIDQNGANQTSLWNSLTMDWTSDNCTIQQVSFVNVDSQAIWVNFDSATHRVPNLRVLFCDLVQLAGVNRDSCALVTDGGLLMGNHWNVQGSGSGFDVYEGRNTPIIGNTVTSSGATGHAFSIMSQYNATILGNTVVCAGANSTGFWVRKETDNAFANNSTNILISGNTFNGVASSAFVQFEGTSQVQVSDNLIDTGYVVNYSLVVSDNIAIFNNRCLNLTAFENVNLTPTNVLAYNNVGAIQSAPAFAASFTPNPRIAQIIEIGALTANITINATVGSSAIGQQMTLVFTQDGTGGRTITWNAVYATGWQPASVAGKVSSLSLIFDGTSWQQVGGQVPVDQNGRLDLGGLALDILVRNNQGLDVAQGTGQLRLGWANAGSVAVAPSTIFSKDVRRSRQTPTETVLVSGVDATAGEIVSVSLTAARVVGAPLNPAVGQNLTFSLTQGGAGGFAVTWNAVFKKTWADTGNTTGKISAISFFYDGTNWIQTGAQSPYV